MKWLTVFIFFTSVTTSAASDDIYDTFGSGVFDTQWGASIGDIQAIYPEGSTQPYGDITHYQIKDGRKVLGITRSEEDSIVFAFDANKRLISVGVYFEGYAATSTIMNKLEAQFGKHQNRLNENSAAPVKEWVGKDISLSLILMPAMFSAQTVFGIEYTGP
jgi:hypothetical protein